MKYIITFTLDDGDEIRIRVEADNQAEALEKIENTPEIITRMEEFRGISAITKVDILPEGKGIEPMADYSITTKDGEEWLCRHDFPRFTARMVDGNEPLADITFDDDCDALTAATAMRDAGDFILLRRQNDNR